MFAPILAYHLVKLDFLTLTLVKNHSHATSQLITRDKQAELGQLKARIACD